MRWALATHEKRVFEREKQNERNVRIDVDIVFDGAYTVMVNNKTGVNDMALTQQTAHCKDINTGLANMEHRHFATIATIIRGTPEEMRLVIAETFADELRHTNPKFDRQRFLAACK